MDLVSTLTTFLLTIFLLPTLVTNKIPRIDGRIRCTSVKSQGGCARLTTAQVRIRYMIDSNEIRIQSAGDHKHSRVGDDNGLSTSVKERIKQNLDKTPKAIPKSILEIRIWWHKSTFSGKNQHLVEEINI